jgi:hypothetical protein
VTVAKTLMATVGRGVHNPPAALESPPLSRCRAAPQLPVDVVPTAGVETIRPSSRGAALSEPGIITFCTNNRCSAKSHIGRRGGQA